MGCGADAALLTEDAPSRALCSGLELPQHAQSSQGAVSVARAEVVWALKRKTEYKLSGRCKHSKTRSRGKKKKNGDKGSNKLKLADRHALRREWEVQARARAAGRHPTRAERARRGGCRVATRATRGPRMG